MEWKRFAEGDVKVAFKRVILWYGVMLLVGLTLAWFLDVKISPEVVIAGALFFYVDIFGIDGGAVYGLAKIVGGRASYERHVAFISWWKLPVLVLQTIGLLIYMRHSWGVLVYYAFVAAELVMFWITLREIHKLPAWRAALILALITAIMVPFFLTDTAIRELTNTLV